MSDYKLLKPNQYNSKGILVEYDSGTIDPSDHRNRPFINEVNKLNEGAKIMAEPLTVFVVLQKWGVKNRNGRIYPKNILIRENEKYQQLIKEGRAIGECVPAGTEIFTLNGWRNIEDVKEGESILTMNIDSDVLEYQNVTDTIAKNYDDYMIHIHNDRGFEIMVTRGHKIVLWDRNDKPYVLTAEELHKKLLANDSKVNHSYIKHSANWIGESPEYFTIPNSEIKIKTELWAAFLGIYLAEGHSAGTKGGKKTNRVCITQVKEDSKNKIKELLDELPFKYYLSNNRQFIIDGEKELYNHLFDLGNSHNKFIPEYAKGWSVDLLDIMLEWMLMGDGRNRKNPKGSVIKEYCTTSSKLMEDTFEIMMKIGKGVTINKLHPVDREIEGRVILAENSKDIYTVCERTSKGVYMDSRFMKSEAIEFNDMVYCVTVPNSTWLMRYNNKISWTHNCDHPETSIISTERVSHNVTKTWWEGQTLMGEMEIIMSPVYINQGIISCQGDHVANLLRKGIMIGVSSRGVGSLKKIAGEDVVQEDFELICWDVVTSPSTPGSWIFDRKDSAAPFVESENKRKPLLEEGLDEFLID